MLTQQLRTESNRSGVTIFRGAMIHLYPEPTAGLIMYEEQ